MTQKGPGIIPDDVRVALKIAACQLSLDNTDSARISGGACEGVVITRWDSYQLGSCYGVLFKAEVESATGTYYVNFLLNLDDLKTGKELLRKIEEEGRDWRVRRDPLPPQMRQFENLRHPTFQ